MDTTGKIIYFILASICAATTAFYGLEWLGLLVNYDFTLDLYSNVLRVNHSTGQVAAFNYVGMHYTKTQFTN